MKVGIIGGGLAGLSAAYYLRKFALSNTISQIFLFEGSDRYGGWIKSEKLKTKTGEIVFESGPRTLRLSTLELKELNTLRLAHDLNLNESIQLISSEHPSAKNRFIYLNGKIQTIEPNLFRRSDLIPKSLAYYMFKEMWTKRRARDVRDESIHDFVSRRIGSEIADNLADPFIKGICGGNIHEISAACMLKPFYDAERDYGSITKGMRKKRFVLDEETKHLYGDLLELKEAYKGQSVWRLKNGLQELTNALAQTLSLDENVKLHLNEPCESINFLENNKIELKTKSKQDTFDLVISGLYSSDLAKLLPTQTHTRLKQNLEKIQAANMVVVNFYFDKYIFPVHGFGYLVPTKESSPLLGCIFDSITSDTQATDHSVLTVMMGGSWYNKYIGDEMASNPNALLNMALGELRKQLEIKDEPINYKISVLKNCIPQYKVGHEQILENIDKYLNEHNLSKQFKLIGCSYNGIGCNDVVFNTRKMIQNLSF